MQECNQCGQPVPSQQRLCADCLAKFDKTLLLNNEITDTKTKPMINQESRKKSKVIHIVISFIAVALLLGYLTTNHLYNNKIMSSKSSPSNKALKSTPESTEFIAYKDTPLLHPTLNKDINVSFYDSKITLGVSTPDDLKKIFTGRKFTESTTGDEYSLFYDVVPPFDEIIFDFKRSVLVRITMTSTSGKETKFITGNGFSLGQTIDQMKQIYGNQFLSSSVANARYEYLDLNSKIYTLFEDLPDHSDEHIDYMFIEKYDLAKPSSYKSFEHEKIQSETKTP